MEKNTARKLDKIYALYADKANVGNGESSAALHKLEELCKKHQVDFEAYLASKQPPTKTEAPKAEAKAAPKPSKPAKVETKTNSRRGMNIRLMREGIWDADSIAEAVFILYPNDFPDIKKNRTSVSGTISDLRKNKSADIKVCSADGRILYR